MRVMPPRHCCCGPTTCPILIDTFERADSSNLGSDWVEESGDAEIVSGDLVMSAGDKVATVAGNSSHRGVAAFVFDTTGSGPWEFNVTLNYGTAAECVANVAFDDDSLTLTTGAQTRTIASTDIGQNDLLKWRRADNNRYTIEVALTNNLFYVKCQGYEATDFAGAAVWDHEFVLPTTGQGRLAIEVVAGDVEINSVEFYRHYDDLNTCPEYACRCPGSNRFTPWKVRIDFFSDDSPGTGCDAFNDGYLLFESARDGGTDTGQNRWECSGGVVAGESFGWGTGNVPYMECNLTIAVDSIYGVSFSACIAVDALDPISVSCYPFTVTFNTFVFSDIPTECSLCTGTSGSFYAVMTDGT